MGQLCAKPALSSVDVTVNDVDLLPEQPPETPSAGGAPGTSDSPRRTSHSISSGKADGSHFRVKSVVYIIGDLPWLLKDLAVKTSDFAGLTEGAEVPPNPVDGPSIAVVSAQVLKERGFGFYVAISADVEGDGNFTYVARTATANPVNVLAPHFTLFSGLTGAGAVHWQEEVHLGAAALAWGPKTKLKFLVIEDHTYGHVGTHKDLALSICRLTDLRSSGGIHDLLLEDESGYPVLAGAGTARSPLAPAFLSVRFSEAEVMRMTRRWSGFVADAAHPLAASDAESNSNIVVEPSSIEALGLSKRSSSSSLMASVLSTLSGSTVRRRPPHAARRRRPRRRATAARPALFTAAGPTRQTAGDAAAPPRARRLPAPRLHDDARHARRRPAVCRPRARAVQRVWLVGDDLHRGELPRVCGAKVRRHHQRRRAVPLLGRRHRGAHAGLARAEGDECADRGCAAPPAPRRAARALHRHPTARRSKGLLF